MQHKISKGSTRGTTGLIYGPPSATFCPAGIRREREDRKPFPKKGDRMLIDSHAHLDMEEFDDDRETVIRRAFEGGLTHIVTVGIDPASSRAAVGLSRAFDGIHAAVGCHPHNAALAAPDVLKEIAEMAESEGAVAWGEIGLDFFRMRAPKEVQEQAFSRQLRLARDLDLPVIVHDREAHDTVFRMIREMGKGVRRGVIHCFSGDVALAKAFISLGYYISIPGTVTYKKAARIKAVAAALPLESMLVETDCPYLAPVPRRGKRNEPAYVAFTAREIARLRGADFEEVARRTSQNARDLFGLDP